MSKFYKISEEELVRLLARSMKLACLENDGVDNWGYYGEGFDADRTKWAVKLGLPLFKIREDGVTVYYEYDYEDIAQKRVEKELNLSQETVRRRIIELFEGNTVREVRKNVKSKN